MNKILILSVTVLIAYGLSTNTNSVFAEQNTVGLYAKGIMDQSGPFAGASFRTIIAGDSATVIHPGQGIELVRMDIKPSEKCVQTSSQLCFEAIVTSIKNTSAHQIGDKILMAFDLANKKQSMTINSGTLQGTTITINLSKIDLKPSGPYTLVFTQEGGIAGIHKTITIDILTAQLTEGSSTISLDDNSISKITNEIKKTKFFNVEQESYPPTEGSADYFTYSIQLTQGTFQKTISWTDTSQEVPDKLIALKDAIMQTAANTPNNQPHLDTIQVAMAKNFVTTAPTFAFDGVDGSLKVQDVKVLESFPEQFVITIGFDCLHGGYGDRTGQMATQAITPHVITITIIDKQVTSAIIDDKWDELNQKPV